MIEQICAASCLTGCIILVVFILLMIITPMKARCQCPECGGYIRVTRIETYKEVQTLFSCTECYYRVLSIEKVEKYGPLE